MLIFNIATLLLWIRIFLDSPLLVRGEYAACKPPSFASSYRPVDWRIAYCYAKWGYIFTVTV